MRSLLSNAHHQCLATQLTTGTSKSPTISKNIVIAQSPQGTRVRSTEIIDEVKVFEEYNKMKQLKDEIENRRQLAQPASQYSDTNQDIAMINIAASPFPTPPPANA